MSHLQTSEELKTFEKEIVVQQSDLDELDHVNNVVYLQWVQDVARAHWEAKAPSDMKVKYIWMVLRHEVDYKGQANLGDRLVVKTWVAWSEGVKSERHVEIRNGETNRILVKAKTLWCLMDAISKRPVKVGREITDIFY